MLNEPLKPMLLHSSQSIPEGPDYIHQIKFDGHRALVHIDQGRVRVFTRNLIECTKQYPELQKIEVNAGNCILDGEMIVLGSDSKPCFEDVMQRFQASKTMTIERLAQSLPVHFVTFDVIYLDGKRITVLPLSERLEWLQKLVKVSNVISVCQSYKDGKSLFKAVVERGLEGIVSKHKHSKYLLDTRSQQWLKIKNYLFDTVQITGIRKKQFAWSLSKNGKYVGMTELVPPNERRAFYEIAQKLIVNEDRDWMYLQPLMTCRVKFQCYTKQGLMRTPSFIDFILK